MFKNSVIMYVVFVLAVIIACGITSSAVERLNKQIESNNASYSVLVKTKDLSKSALNMETGARGFFLNKNALFLQPFYSGQTEFKAGMTELKQIDILPPGTKEKLLEAERIHIEWANQTQALVASISKEEMKRNFPDFKEDKKIYARINATALDRKSLMDTFRSYMQTIESEENLRLKISLEETNKYKNYIRFVLFAGPIVTVAVIFFLTRIIERTNKDKDVVLDRLAEERKKNGELTETVSKLTASIPKPIPKKTPTRKPRKESGPETTPRKPRKTT